MLANPPRQPCGEISLGPKLPVGLEEEQHRGSARGAVGSPDLPIELSLSLWIGVCVCVLNVPALFHEPVAYGLMALLLMGS